MQNRLGLIVAVAATVLIAIVATSVTRPAGQAQSTTASYRAPRGGDGKPDLNGIWQAMNSAHWDLEAHAARQGPMLALGAAFSVPGGQSVVEGGTIPYLPPARAMKEENAKEWLTRDPEIKCYMPGIPRATYMPYPFQIVQASDHVLMAYEFASASRIIYLDPKVESPAETWMGHARGRWDGDTFVVEVTDFNDQTWFDRSGNFHSNALRVVERYTRIGPDTLQYEATIEDPAVFSRPWTIRMPLYRRLEPNAQLIEYKCVEFSEEVLYGHLRRKATE